jgi:glycosyltransferase involved in cell wall biosynthesis
MTGGCHYNWDCDGFTKECGKCPAINSQNLHDISYHNLQFKKQYLTPINFITFGGPDVPLSSLFFKNQNKRIFVPVNPEVFHPGDKVSSRKYFGILPDKKVIFFGAQYLYEERKGIHLLIEALNILKKNMEEQGNPDSIFLIFAGRSNPGLKNALPFNYKDLGLLNTDTQLPFAFQAADVFVSPSLQDAGPLMINMSVMTGIPVIAFNIGVARDLVVDGKTGWRVETGNVIKFAEAIQNVISLDENEYAVMSNNTRALALDLCNPQRQIDIIEESLMQNNS